MLKLEGTFSFAAPEYVRIWKGFQRAQLIEATDFKVSTTTPFPRAAVYAAIARMACAAQVACAAAPCHATFEGLNVDPPSSPLSSTAGFLERRRAGV